MRKKVITVLCLAGFAFSFGPGAAADQNDTAAKITEASKTLLDPSTTRDAMTASLLQLLDIAALITTASQYKDQIQYRIDVAKDLLKNDSLFNDKARQYLSFAYRMMTNGKKYQKPKELDEFVTPEEAMEKSRAHAKKLVEEALANLKNGREAETARLLLEIVLGVVTPLDG